MTTEQKALAKKRRSSNLWIMALLLITATLYRYTPEMLAFLSGSRPEEIADLGVEVLQRGFVAMLFLPWAIVFSAIMASIVQSQLREDAFGTMSRWGVIFVTCVVCFILTVT